MSHVKHCEDHSMRSRPTGLLFAVLALLPAAAGAVESAHEHGLATLQIVIDGSILQANLEIPAHDVIGFEHPPSTPTQVKAVAEALAHLRQTAQVIAPTRDAGCTATVTQIDAAPGLEEAPPAASHAPEPAHEKHTDFRLTYTLQCARQAALKDATTGLFALLPGLERLRIRLLSAGRARQLLLTRPANHIDFEFD